MVKLSSRIRVWLRNIAKIFRNDRTWDTEGETRMAKKYNRLVREIKRNWHSKPVPTAPWAKHATKCDGFLLGLKGNRPHFSVLRDSVLIDLGAGTQPEAMIRFASHYGANSYIAVDTGLDGARSQLEVGKTRAIFREIDMLEFIAGYNGHANICLNGIDGTVLAHKDHTIVLGYVQSLLEEVVLRIPTNGILFGVGTPFLNTWKRFIEARGLEGVCKTGDYVLKPGYPTNDALYVRPG